jgi:hypothetical protein
MKNYLECDFQIAAVAQITKNSRLAKKFHVRRH